MTTPPTPASTAPRATALEAAIGRVLQLGVFLAIAAALAGGLIHFIGQPIATVSFATFKREEALFTSPLLTLSAAARGDGLALMQLAVLILIATPIIRVLASLILFITRRDALYIAITLVVIAALAAGLFGGAH
jgi:uncharacterized membrane protein